MASKKRKKGGKKKTPFVVRINPLHLQLDRLKAEKRAREFEAELERKSKKFIAELEKKPGPLVRPLTEEEKEAPRKRKKERERFRRRKKKAEKERAAKPASDEATTTITAAEIFDLSKYRPKK